MSLFFAISGAKVVLACSKRETISVTFGEQVYKFVAEVVKCAYRAVLIKYFAFYFCHIFKGERISIYSN